MKVLLLIYAFSGLVLLTTAMESLFASGEIAAQAAGIFFKNTDSCKKDPDYKKNTHELIVSKGYPAETYTVETDDHYVLTIHRIPNGNGYKGDKTPRPVMFLQHGMLGASDNFVMNFKESSLGFIAYDRGYDVWMGNFRGNTYSRKNTRLLRIDPRFWLFSWDKIGQKDLPAMINFVLRTTGQKKVNYVGHSMGTTSVLALLASQPEYQSKIKAAALLSPVATLHHSTNPIFLLTPIRNLLIAISALGGIPGELFPNSISYVKAIKTVCSTKIVDKLCGALVKLFLSEGPAFNQSRICVYMNSFPAGTSTYAAIHYAQLRKSKNFQRYDYGLANFFNYGKFSPPKFDLRKITIPVGLYWSEDDDMTDDRDINILKGSLGNVSDFLALRGQQFTHLDFAIGLNAPKLVYPSMFKFFEKV